MPLLSRLYGLNAASPLAALGQPGQPTPFMQPTPAEGAGQPTPNFAVGPAAAPYGNAPAPKQNSFNPNAPQLQAGTQTPFWQRLQSGAEGLQNNSLFNIGMSLLAGSENGGDWGVVQDRMRQFGQDQQQRQMIQNEQRRQKVGDAREGTIFERQQQEWGRQDEQRQSLDEWVATLSPEDQAAARANPQAAHGAYMEAQAAARMPITPFQQRQLDLQARALALDAQRIAQQAAQEEWIPRGPDMVTMRNLQASAEQAMEGRYLLDQFEAANRRTGTGGGTQWLPWHGLSADRAMMSQASSLIQTMTAPQNQGAVSNMERDLFRQAAPTVDLTGDQNYARIQTARDLMDFRVARAAFFSDYGRRNRTLNGAEAAFQRSPEYDAIAARVRARTQPDGGSNQQQSQRQPQSGDITPEQARAELERRQAQRRRPQQSVRPGNF